MTHRRAIFRRHLLQALTTYAAYDGQQLLDRIKNEGRIVDVFHFSESKLDFFNLSVDVANFQPELPSTAVRLSVSVTDTETTESGTLLVRDDFTWVEDQLFSLGK